MNDDVLPVYDETDTIHFVDRATYLRVTTPPSGTLERYAAALQAAGYAVIRAEAAKEMLQAHQLVHVLKARAQARRLAERGFKEPETT